LNRYILGVFLVVIAGVCYGFSPILAVYAYRGGASVADYVFLRYGIASLFYLLYILIYKRSIFKALGRIKLALPLMAGSSQAVSTYLYMSTVKSISAGLAAILFYTYIVWVAVWGFVFKKERLKIKGIAGIALALTGLALVVGVSWGKISTIGIFMGQAAALVCSAVVMASNETLKQLEPVVASAFISFFTAIPLFLLGSATGALHLQMSLTAWLAAIASAIISCNFALFAFMAGMERVGSTTASVLCTAEPVTAVVFSALLLSEKMTALQMLGGMVLLIGAVLVVTAKKTDSAEILYSRSSHCASKLNPCERK